MEHLKPIAAIDIHTVTEDNFDTIKQILWVLQGNPDEHMDEVTSFEGVESRQENTHPFVAPCLAIGIDHEYDLTYFYDSRHPAILQDTSSRYVTENPRAIESADDFLAQWEKYRPIVAININTITEYNYDKVKESLKDLQKHLFFTTRYDEVLSFEEVLMEKSLRTGAIGLGLDYEGDIIYFYSEEFVTHSSSAYISLNPGVVVDADKLINQ